MQALFKAWSVPGLKTLRGAWGASHTDDGEHLEQNDTPSSTPVASKQTQRQKRRYEQFQAQQTALASSIPVSEADALVAKLMSTKEGRKLVPNATAVDL